MEQTFQIVDILSDDITIKDKRFVITLYGINQKNERIVCHVLKYCPYYFIKIPNNWDTCDGEKLFKTICKSNKKLLNSVKSYEIDISKDFYGFYWDEINQKQKLFNYLKINFYNLSDMKKSIQEVKKFYNNENNVINYSHLKDWWSVDKTYINDSNLYESNLHPIIRFIHDTKIDPTGWVKITPSSKCKFITDGYENIEFETSCSYKDIQKYDCSDASKYIIASFDIECDSSHGDFPLAKKDFKKLSSELFDSIRNLYLKSPPTYKNCVQNSSIHKIEKYIHYSFDLVSDKGDLDSLEIKFCDISKTYTINNIKPSTESIKIISNNINQIQNLNESLLIDKINSKNRDTIINQINDYLKKLSTNENEIIQVKGDEIIQIGTVFHQYGDKKPFEKHILVIGPKDNMLEKDICDSLDHIDIDVDTCSDEKELLLKWSEKIKEIDPDFITGYNIFGFDFKYIKERVDYHFDCHHRCNKWGHHSDCEKRIFYDMGKLSSSYKYNEHRSKTCKYNEQKLSSSALGDNDLSYITMDGRILFDIMKEVQKGHNLESYKLDTVASHFMRGKLKNISSNFITVDSIGHLKNEDYISFRMHSNIGEELYKDGHKIKIKNIQEKVLELDENLDLSLNDYHKIEWCLNKDDVSPQDIFNKHKQIENGSQARSEIAKYCIQDCELCINLLLLLDIIPNNLAMANVSYVPASYIFLRGQGVKVTSVVTKKCSEMNTKIPDLKPKPRMGEYRKMFENGSSDEEIKEKIIEKEGGHGYSKPKDYELKEWLDEIKSKNFKIEGFEGAIVLPPKEGIYLDDPIAVLDYASLYPSSIIEKNLSHETYIEDESLIDIIGKENLHCIQYDNYIYRGKGKGDTIEKIIDENEPVKTCYFLKSEFMEENNIAPKGIIPSVLDHLLKARNDTKRRMKTEPDEFKKKVLDGLQLAYKVTANSVYGQLGARTSTIYKMNIAACTTSIGRERIDDASNGVKKWAHEKGYEEPDIVYGDTDSVFVKFSRKDLNGKLLEGKEALNHCIQCGREAGDYITKGELLKNNKMIQHIPLLHKPQDLEYEKTFWPFILISKKRYTGDKYEYNTEDYKRTSMGIVLKRRDNAPIVKYVFGNVIEIIMIEKDLQKAIDWLRKTLHQIRNGQFSDSKYVITKSLRGYYKNPQQIAHKVLADRMALRDPGNKPKSNDRIPYAYIELSQDQLYDTKNPYKSGVRKGQPRLKNVLQGDRIEHIDHIRKNNLKLDYEFYITNQIMNPVKQVLDLVLPSDKTELIFK